VTSSNDGPFQTKTQIVALLDSLGRRPVHRFGQNFLIDRNLMQRLVDSAEITRHDCILEVGPGTGSLTGLLLERAGRVVSVEIDTHLADHLDRTFADQPQFQLVRGDCLQDKSTLAPALVDAVTKSCSELGAGAVKLVANLPYDAATPLVIDLLLSDLPVTRLCFTVQSEVADRFLAAPSTRDYGPVGILVQALTTARRTARCPPQAFWPAPKVHSTMLQLDVNTARPASLAHPGKFAALVRAMFQHRRKTLINNARTLENADRVIDAIGQLGIDANVRPENLSVAEWIQLWEQVRA